MKRYPIILIAVLHMILFCGYAHCDQYNAVKSDEIMDINQLEPGMKGYGKTVFSGTRIETFNVEILGVLNNYNAKNDLILVKCSSPVVDKAGIISGMSGSPIYINGKIIGALSYAWPFAKEPIAGVTPIAEMLKILDIDTQSSKHAIKTSAPLAVKSNAAERYGQARFMPIKTPLMVSGFDSRVLDIMGSELDTLGMTPIQSGGNNGTILREEDLVPGSAVAAQLVRGDISATAVGTVSYRKGKQILAFGHPFMQMGELDIPMSGAYVHTTLPSLSLSAKMASPTNVLGRISQDRKTAIAGIIGEYSNMIPCHVEIKSYIDSSYDFEIIHNSLFTANLCQMAFLNSILSTEKQSGEIFVKMVLKIFITGLKEPIKLKDLFFGVNTGWLSVSEIIQPINILLNNKFRAVNIEKIEFTAKIENEPKAAQIDNISVNKSVVPPGGDVTVNVKLRPYRGKLQQKSVKLKIPHYAKPGSKIVITACASNQNMTINMARSPGKYRPANFEQLVDLLNESEPNNELVVRAMLPKKGVSYKGEQFAALPPSLLTVMAWPTYSGTTLLATEDAHRIKTEWALTGGQSIFISVKK